MTIAKAQTNLTAQRMTLQDYLNFDDGTDTRYELVDGILTEMGAEADINIVIDSFLFSIFLKFVPYYCIRKGTEIAVAGTYANTWFPDLMVLTQQGATALADSKRSIVMFDMPAPALVVEVVSNSDTDKASRERDYVRKRAEYAQRGIPEYWIIDPVAEIVWILTLVNKVYQEKKYVGAQQLASHVFSKLELNAMQVLNAGM